MLKEYIANCDVSMHASNNQFTLPSVRTFVWKVESQCASCHTASSVVPSDLRRPDIIGERNIICAQSITLLRRRQCMHHMSWSVATILVDVGYILR